MDATYRPDVMPTAADVDCWLGYASEMVDAYLEGQGVPATEDGFRAVAPSGDEDPDTMRRYQEVYRPLKGLIDAIARVRRSPAFEAAELAEERTWRSRQLEVLACTGAEPDARIAAIYRASLGTVEAE